MARLARLATTAQTTGGMRASETTHCQSPSYPTVNRGWEASDLAPCLAPVQSPGNLLTELRPSRSSPRIGGKMRARARAPAVDLRPHLGGPSPRPTTTARFPRPSTLHPAAPLGHAAAVRQSRTWT